MSRIRRIEQVFTARETIEGAGVRLHRAFGYNETPLFDPFLMLDDFRGDNPEDYIRGFPWHPHRGIETVTYMLEGRVKHGDSMGNAGFIGAGDLQWMTAGSGIIHQEMPEPVDGRMGGFQLWVNLPARDKFIQPRYQEIASGDIPTVSGGDGVAVRVIAGSLGGVRGPVRDIVADPTYLDISLGAGASFHHEVTSGYTCFLYVYGGSGRCGEGGRVLQNRNAVLTEDGEAISLTAGPHGFRVLFFSGMPIREPIAWRGPIVMNTEEELQQAFSELRDGTFIKPGTGTETTAKRHSNKMI